MKYFNKILLVIFFFFMCIGKACAKDGNLVNVYLFYSKSCPHCKAANKALNEIKEEYNNLKIYKYEISEEESFEILDKVSEILDFDYKGVPITIIGDKVYKGYNNENSYRIFKGTIDYYSKYGYIDKVGELLGKELPIYEIKEDQIKLEDYISDYGEYSFKIPLIGKVSTKNLTLPIITIVIGLLDGFNPCAMWILIFLISMLIGMKDKKRMWILGLTFIFTSAFIYLLFMLSWLNITSLLSSVTLFKIVIGIIALICGSINVISYFKHRKEDGCNVTNMKQRKKIMSKIKKLTNEKNFFIAIIGIMALAVSVNIIELACSAGLPVMFIEILNMNNLSNGIYGIYILLYILMFMLDDIIIFLIAMLTLNIKGISTKYGKITKLCGGVVLILIGLLMLFKPEILMFNF